MIAHSPNSVGSRASATRCTSRSLLQPVRDQLRDGDEREPVLAAANSSSCGRSRRRAVGVAGSRRSRRPGWSPASRARSTAASVCPTRCSTPPSRARSGCTWPPCAGRRGPLAGSAADADRVRAVLRADAGGRRRSAAPRRCSRCTPCAARRLFSAHQRQAELRRSARSVSARQISPLPRFIMKLMISGVTSSAAQIRSPSFSRSSSSATTTILPAREVLDRLLDGSEWHGSHGRADGRQLSITAAATARAASHVLADHVRLDVHAVARRAARRASCASSVYVDQRQLHVSGAGSAFTVRLTPSTVIEPCGTIERRERRRGGARRRAAHRRGAELRDHRPTPSTCPCTMCPPSRSPERSARSRFTRRPTAQSPIVVRSSVVITAATVNQPCAALAHREARAVHRDALARREVVVGGADAELAPGLRGPTRSIVPTSSTSPVNMQVAPSPSARRGVDRHRRRPRSARDSTMRQRGALEPPGPPWRCRTRRARRHRARPAPER